MGFITIFTIGVVVGGVAKWQVDRRRNKQGTPWSADEQPDLQTDLQTGPDTISKSEHPIEANLEANLTEIISLDRLEQIQGITPHFARLLNQAGILSYIDLADQTVIQLQMLVAPDFVTETQVETWLEHAKELANN